MVGFPNSFQEVENPSEGIRKLDPDLISKLTTSEELSALFNLLMFALRGVLKKKKISINEKTIQERREKYEIATNPIDVFIKASSRGRFQRRRLDKEGNRIFGVSEIL